MTTQFVPPVLTADHVVIDGLFGSGLNKALSGGFAAVVKYINASPATVVSIDIPSGLMGEDNTYNVHTNIVRAHLTLSLQLPKLAFLFAENEPYVGEWQLLDIGLSEDAIHDMETDFRLLEHEDVSALLSRGSRFAHKGELRPCTADSRFAGNGGSFGAGCACLSAFGGGAADGACAVLQQLHCADFRARSHDGAGHQRHLLCRRY